MSDVYEFASEAVEAGAEPEVGGTLVGRSPDRVRVVEPVIRAGMAVLEEMTEERGNWLVECRACGSLWNALRPPSPRQHRDGCALVALLQDMDRVTVGRLPTAAEVATLVERMRAAVAAFVAEHGSARTRSRMRLTVVADGERTH